MNGNGEWGNGQGLAKVCCILCDYFKTEGLNPESYLNEVTRYKREER